VGDKNMNISKQNRHYYECDNYDNENKNFSKSWKELSSDMEFAKNNVKKEEGHIVTSLIVAFLIIIISAQFLGFVNNVVTDKYLQEKHKDNIVVVYSNIG